MLKQTTKQENYPEEEEKTSGSKPTHSTHTHTHTHTVQRQLFFIGVSPTAFNRLLESAQHYFTHIQDSMNVNHIVNITKVLWTIEGEREKERERASDS